MNTETVYCHSFTFTVVTRETSKQIKESLEKLIGWSCDGAMADIDMEKCKEVLGYIPHNVIKHNNSDEMDKFFLDILDSYPQESTLKEDEKYDII